MVSYDDNRSVDGNEARSGHHFRDIVRVGGLVFLNRILGAGMGFLVGIMAARLIGAEALGLYSLAMAFMFIGSVTGRLGLDNVLLRRVSAGIGGNDWGEALAAQRTSMVLALAGSTALAIILAVLATPIADFVYGKPALAAPLILCAMAILPLSALNMLVQSLNATNRAAIASFVHTALPALGILVGLGAAAGLGAFWNAADLSLLHLAALTAVTLIAWVLWLRVSSRHRKTRAYTSVRPMLRAGLPLLWVTLIGIAMVTVDVLMLGLWRDAEIVGYYAAAARTAGLMGLALAAMNTVVAPKISRFHAQGRMTQLSEVVRGASFLLGAATLPVLVIFLFVPGYVMRLYGDAFAAGATALAVLAVGQFVNAACGSVGMMLVMTGHERLMRNITIATGVLNIVLNALLIPPLGATGAAVATAGSMAAHNIISAIYVYRIFSINMVALFDRNAARAVLSGGIAAGSAANTVTGTDRSLP